MDREYTVPQLAIITDRSQDYVRQHIKRGHLRTRKDGKAVLVALNDGRAWAEKWQLRWNEAALDEGPPMAKLPGRIARVRVVTSEYGGGWINVLTTIRHRSGSKTRPWQVLHELPNGLVVIGADLSMPEAQAFVDQAVTAEVEVLDRRIAFSLADRRTHFGGHGEQTGLRSGSIHSPFSTHAAQIVEYWSIDDPHPEIASKADRSLPWQKLAGFNLGVWSDRIGNLLVFGALEDATVIVNCGEGEISLELKSATPFRPEAYRASVIAWLDDDCVLGRTIAFDKPTVRLPVVPDLDAFHVTLFGSDGSLLDEHANYLLREISTQMVLSGPEMTVRDGKKEVYRLESRRRDTAMLTGERSNEIRRKQISRRARNADAAARKQGLTRFSPSESNDAIDQLAQLIRRFEGDEKTILYLADPYFLMLDTTTADHQRTFLKVVEACEGRELRILSGVIPEKALERWRSFNPQLRRNVALRSFALNRAHLEEKEKPAFHDRFVACKAGEVLITHSLNGWADGGVTFCRVPFNVYLMEAESLWNTTRSDVKIVDVFHG